MILNKLTHNSRHGEVRSWKQRVVDKKVFVEKMRVIDDVDLGGEMRLFVEEHFNGP